MSTSLGISATSAPPTPASAADVATQQRLLELAGATIQRNAQSEGEACRAVLHAPLHATHPLLPSFSSVSHPLSPRFRPALPSSPSSPIPLSLLLQIFGPFSGVFHSGGRADAGGHQGAPGGEGDGGRQQAAGAVRPRRHPPRAQRHAVPCCMPHHSMSLTLSSPLSPPFLIPLSPRFRPALPSSPSSPLPLSLFQNFKPF
ncbi:unnamed protein product [Closterium sp. Naga37s-1]|nr:unnamed protein product [Closterium sp. Naga37s-1]